MRSYRCGGLLRYPGNCEAEENGCVCEFAHDGSKTAFEDYLQETQKQLLTRELPLLRVSHENHKGLLHKSKASIQWVRRSEIHRADRVTLTASGGFLRTCRFCSWVAHSTALLILGAPF